MVRLHVTRLASLLIAASTICSAEIRLPAFADGNENTTKTLPSDVQTIASHVDDLDLLVALNPVKLTSDQIDKFLAVLEPISKSDDELTKQECDSMRAIAADVDKARMDALKGALPDADTTAKINKTLAEFTAKNAAAHKDAVMKVLDVAKSTLTAEQFKAIQHKYAQWCGGSITVPGELRDDAAKRATYLQDISTTEFANRIFLLQRTVPLLKALKNPPASNGASSPASPAGSGDKTGTAPPRSSPPR